MTNRHITRRGALAAASLALPLALPLATTARAQGTDTLAAIKARGKLVAGVKNDYRPYGFLNPAGETVGLELDLAHEVAQRIGVTLETVPVIAANRIEFLVQNRIDMILATLGDTPERRKVIGMVEPNYYAGATNVLAPKSAGFKTWEQLRGRKVCAVQGAYYNRRVAQLYGPDLLVFPAVPDALNALAAGNCAAFLFDNTLIVSTLAGDPAKWGGYEMPLPSEDPQLWAIGVRQADLHAPFGELLSGMCTEWLRTGHILALEKKWGIEPSPYLVEMQHKLG